MSEPEQSKVGGEWYWDFSGNKVYRNPLELRMLHEKIPCTCGSRFKDYPEWCANPISFPAKCKVEGYKQFIREDLTNGLLSNYQWLRELATEVAQEMKDEV